MKPVSDSATESVGTILSVKLQTPRRKHYLGQTGIVRTRGDEKSDGRELFLKAVELHAPAVLQDLRKQVYDRWNERTRRRGVPIPKYLKRSIRDWAIRWNLTWKGHPADWIIGQVECTFSDWVNYPNLDGCSWGTFPGSHQHLPVVHLFEISEGLVFQTGNAKRDSPWDRIEQRARSVMAGHRRDTGPFTFEMAVDEVLKREPGLYNDYLKAPSHHATAVACMPTAYPLKQIKKTLRELKASVQNVMKHMGSDRKFRKYLNTASQLPPLEKARSIDKEHFVWAVRFQCLGHTYAGIAASQDLNWIAPYDHLDDEKLVSAEYAQPAIATGIRDILALVELTPRSGDKVGLPKRSKEKS
jgi:hypothetical protein